MKLSKSLYTRGLQCVRSLWLKKYNPDILEEPNEFAKSIFETGNKVGDLACGLFPNGKEVSYDGTTFEEKIALTKKWLDEGVENIYEATFEYDDVLVMVDILHKKDDGTFEMYEVKSSTWKPKSKLKEIEKYIHDASIQYYVLKGLGYNISKCSITMLNSEYVHDGDKLKLDKLFIHIDVTNEVKELQANIPTYLKTFQKVLENKENEPDIDIGQHCFKPYVCDAYEYCWGKENIPKFSIFDIFSKSKKLFDMYHQGIVNLEDIPQEKLNENQLNKIKMILNKEVKIDKQGIKNFLDTLTYPIYHLDFETYMDAVPTFKNQRPYQQIPFQYSLHIEYKDGRLEHKEFLADENGDPREEFIKRLILDIPNNACVLVYNEGFEKTRIKELARDFPKYEQQLLNINDNIIDLATPFREKYYDNYTLKGKYSIKLIMPLLVPEMQNAYKELELVQNGGDAMNTFPKLKNMTREQRDRHRCALLKYCELDTLSMVKILEKLKEMGR